mgnify:CR=1 FL=1
MAELGLKKHILITGGTGYIGNFLRSKLLNSGYKVTSVSRSVGFNNNHFGIDLTNKKLVEEFAHKLSHVDIIIHCAAIAHGEKPPKNYSAADFNTLITKNLLKAFENNQVHWIFISSISVYGETHSKSQTPIIFSPKSVDKYGKGKLFDESLFISKCKNLDILRLMPVYDSENLKDIKKRVYFPKTNVKIAIWPSPFYSLCNIEKVLSAVHKSISYGSGQRIAHVGDNEPASQKDLLGWFSGITIFLPRALFSIVFFLLPKKPLFFRTIALMIKKIALNNIYEIGVRELE